MSWSHILCWAASVSGIACIGYGTRYRRNRMRKGVLPPPSTACKRATTEAVP